MGQSSASSLVIGLSLVIGHWSLVILTKRINRRKRRSHPVGRFWSLLFLMVPILGVGVFVWAINGWWGMAGHWLPQNINASGGVIDNLFNFIMYLTGVIFIGTSLALFWFMW